MVGWPCRLRRQRRKTAIVIEKCGFFGFGTPGLRWPNNHPGIPLILGGLTLAFGPKPAQIGPWPPKDLGPGKLDWVW